MSNDINAYLVSTLSTSLAVLSGIALMGEVFGNFVLQELHSHSRDCRGKPFGHWHGEASGLNQVIQVTYLRQLKATSIRIAKSRRAFVHGSMFKRIDGMKKRGEESSQENPRSPKSAKI